MTADQQGPATTSAALRAANAAFLEAHPAVLTPAEVFDRCYYFSTLYLDYLADLAIAAHIVSGVQMAGGVVLRGHYAVQVAGTVVDWTYRQFDPAAPVPRILTPEQWDRDWPALAAP